MNKFFVGKVNLYEMRGARLMGHDELETPHSEEFEEMMKITSPEEKPECKFQIEFANKRRLAFIADSHEDKINWCNDIIRVINENEIPSPSMDNDVDSSIFESTLVTDFELK
jgi:hypothetical protein